MTIGSVLCWWVNLTYFQCTRNICHPQTRNCGRMDSLSSGEPSTLLGWCGRPDSMWISTGSKSLPLVLVSQVCCKALLAPVIRVYCWHWPSTRQQVPVPGGPGAELLSSKSHHHWEWALLGGEGWDGGKDRAGGRSRGGTSSDPEAFKPWGDPWVAQCPYLGGRGQVSPSPVYGCCNTHRMQR